MPVQPAVPPMVLQDYVAIAVALAAAAWLVRRLVRSAVAPACGPAPDLPPGADGFVPSAGLTPPPRRRTSPDRP